jgi:hypothetical protein
MKTVKGTVLCFISISIDDAALGCGNAINGASNGWGKLGYTLLSLSMLFTALILAIIGVSAENERIERENRKIKRVPHHTNEWRDAQ